MLRINKWMHMISKIANFFPVLESKGYFMYECMYVKIPLLYDFILTSFAALLAFRDSGLCT